jgi:hypothetical protein
MILKRRSEMLEKDPYSKQTQLMKELGREWGKMNSSE